MNKIDILLVAPPFSYGALDKASPRCAPIGIATLASILRNKGYSVKIIDAFGEDLSVDEVVKRIEEINPRILGITGVTASYPNTIEIFNKIKETDLDFDLVVYGGPHATILSHDILKKLDVDVCVIGEGDETIVELADLYLKDIGDIKKIKGIVYADLDEKYHVKVVTNEPREQLKEINSLPMPAYDLLPMSKYRPYATLDLGRKFSSLTTSRGCPYKCIYCTSSRIFGKRWVARSYDKVWEEMLHLEKNYGVTHFYFQDDEFTVDQERVHKLCDLIIENKKDWVMECLTRVDKVNEPLLKKMAQAGFKSVIYGVECGYEDGLKKIQKFITLDQARDAVKWSKKHKIDCRVTFILGFPWEGIKEIKQTVKFAKELNADYTYFNLLDPYPGTPVYNMIKDEGLFVDEGKWEEYVSHGTMPVVRTRFLTREELAKLNGKAYMSVYTSPRYVLRKLTKIRNLRDLKRNVGGGSDLIKLSLKRMLSRK